MYYSHLLLYIKFGYIYLGVSGCFPILNNYLSTIKKLENSFKNWYKLKKAIYFSKKTYFSNCGNKK